MPLQEIALVAVENVAYHFDKPYAYLVPEQYAGLAAPGERVVVPFGRSNAHRRGVILEKRRGAAESGVKPLLKIVDLRPILSGEMLELAKFLKGRTFCTLFEAFRLMIPLGMSLKLKRIYSVRPDVPSEALAMLVGDEKQIAEILKKRPLERKRLLETAGLPQDSGLPEHLVKRGILRLREEADLGGELTRRVVSLAVSEEQTQSVKLTLKQKNVLKAVKRAGEPTVSEAAALAGVTAAVVNTLVKKGILKQSERPVRRDPCKGLKGEKEVPPPLSPQQQRAYEDLLKQYRAGKASASLLYGVTGSGKTQVFMKLIENVRRDGRGVIVLVPEISLTPQAVSRFYRRFGGEIAVFHSGLSTGERADQWRRIASGDAGIVIGTRSAVFAPVADLGLIIMDEEQEYTYKSESSPRYHARDVARFRCAGSNAMMLLSSATPCVESAYAALSGRYSLSRLDERFGDALLPQVITVDMKEELAHGNDGPVSARLLAELQKNLASGEQSILLINRRGCNPFVCCSECGHVMTCPNCSIALTYHLDTGSLMCHYCGYSIPRVDICPECGGKFMRYSGYGTQKAEQTLHELLPQARILRMDTDTTGTKFAHEKILKKFASREYDILIGTQMVAKGLDFPNVTLVGVLSADQMLYMDDFRAAERTFSLLTQVVGRSGRGSLLGRAVIQTGTPDNEVIRLAARQDYAAFYRAEIALRKELLYPPFCDLCLIGFSGPEEEQVGKLAKDFGKRLGECILGDGSIPARVMGPSPAAVYKVKNRYRWRIIVKCRNDRHFRSLLSGLLVEFGRHPFAKRTAVYADMNPLDII